MTNPTRMIGLLAVGLGIAAGSGCRAGTSGAAAPADRPPSIVLILADDLGWGEVGAYGQRDILTPTLDRLAAEGMRFTDFYSSSPVCAPARCALMTGLHNGHCRLSDNDQTWLRPEDVTLAEVLRARGYATGLFGKWGLSFNDHPESFPTAQGFDRFLGYLDQRHAHNYYTDFLVTGPGDTLRLPNVVPDRGRYGQGNASVEHTYADSVILEGALDFIRDNQARPFFLYLAGTIPHINNEGRRDPDAGFEVPDLGPYADRPWPLPKRAYAAMVTRLDANVGRVLALLDELRLREQTVVVFLSDNGATFLRAAHDGTTDTVGLWFRGTGPFRGFKYDVYEGGIRVPAIVRWPGRVRPGTVSDVPGYFPDLLPTLAGLAGAAAPAALDGRDLRPVWEEREAAADSSRFLFWHFDYRDQYAVRMGRWKAVWVGDRGAELYDLSADPGERADVAARHPDVVDRLTSVRRREATGPAPPR